jgi:hypothetical protein
MVYRIINNRLVLISDGFSEAIDLDGDGVPEVLGLFYAGQNECGVSSFISLQRWNGKRFVEDRQHRWVTVLSARDSEDQVQLSDSKRYAVRLFGPGRVTVDEKEIAPGKPFDTEEGCHTIALHGGSAKTRAFLEELPR